MAGREDRDLLLNGMKIVSKSVAETKKFARQFLDKISKTVPTATGGAVVVGLYGNLGSGKTTLVQCVAEVLGVAEHITSPTFVIMKSYKLSPRQARSPEWRRGTTFNFQLLTHIDAYRLKSAEELRALGFEKLLRDGANLILVEWADQVVDILPPEHIKLQFKFINETTRKITFD